MSNGPSRLEWRGIRAKLGVVCLVLLVLASAYHLGVFARVAEPRTLAATLLAMGAWGYVAFIASYTVLQPFLSQTVYGWIFCCHMIGAGIAAYAGGFFREILGDYHLIFISAALLGFIAAGLSMSIRVKTGAKAAAEVQQAA